MVNVAKVTSAHQAILYFCNHVSNLKHGIEPGPSHFRIYLTTALGNI